VLDLFKKMILPSDVVSPWMRLSFVSCGDAVSVDVYTVKGPLCGDCDNDSLAGPSCPVFGG